MESDAADSSRNNCELNFLPSSKMVKPGPAREPSADFRSGQTVASPQNLHL